MMGECVKTGQEQMSDTETLNILGTAMMLAMGFAGLAAAVSKGQVRQMWLAILLYPLYLMPFWFVAWLFS